MCALNCGIIGLPNVGKSSLFNILTKTQAAEAANYPFCTIEPNKATIAVKDPRLAMIAKIFGSQNIIYSQIAITDIAGLVKGASKGEGLGNQFLSHIREVDAIIHVVRLFEDADVIHVDDKINPLADKEIIELELIFADLQNLDNRLPKLEKKAKSDKEAAREIELIKEIKEVLEQGKLPNKLEFSPEDKIIVDRFQLLTTKPMIYLCNISEDEFIGDKYKNNKSYQELVNIVGANNILALPIKFESDFIDMTDEERIEFIQSCGANPENLQNLLKQCYSILGLQSFFTVGPKEARSWEIKKGTNAQHAAGAIHSDIERGFIRAETMGYDDFIKYNGEAGVRNAGRFRTEGKEYIVQDADILNFLHSS